MFTGLIETIGTVKSVRSGAKSIEIGVLSDLKDFSVKIGDSVAINGSCLTVVSVKGHELFFTAVAETVSQTTISEIFVGSRVNMERAMRLGDRLDGHIVQGHIDGVGKVVEDKKVGDSVVKTIEMPQELMKFMTHKGSVAVDGISLTIASVSKKTITLSLIPHTLKETTLITKKRGDFVNIECDLFARYIFTQLETSGLLSRDTKSKDGGLLTLLENNGF